MLSLSLNSFFTRQAASQAQRVSNANERLASAKRVNRASDDAAGLSIAEKMRAQVRGNQQAARNIQDAISMVRIGLDGVEGTFSVLQRLRELIVQAANGTYAPEQLQAIQDEMDILKRQLPEAYGLAQQARINFDGNPFDRALDFQIGANEGETMRVDYNPLRNDLLSVITGAFGYNELADSEYAGLMVSITFPAPPPAPSPATDALWPKKLVVNPNTADNISTALTFIDDALGKMIKQAGYLGSQINSLEHSLFAVQNSVVQQASAESQIRDADMAAEMTERTKAALMEQTAIATVAQSNLKPTLLLELVLNTSDEQVRNAEASAQGQP